MLKVYFKQSERKWEIESQKENDFPSGLFLNIFSSCRKFIRHCKDDIVTFDVTTLH